MKQKNFMKKVQTLLAVFAVCILASCFGMQVDAAAGPFMQSSEATEANYPATCYVYVEAGTHLGNTVAFKYSTIDPTVANGTTTPATYIGVNSKTGKSIYVITEAKFAPASTVYLKYESTDAFQAVTAPVGAPVISQTNATKTSVTLQWTAISGATGYNVYAGTSSENMSLLATVPGTSHTLSGLSANTGYYILVEPYKANAQGTQISWDFNYGAAITAPTKVSGVKLDATFKNEHKVAWKDIPTATGFEIKVTNAKGKKITTATETDYVYHIFNNKKMSSQAWKVKVRAYVTMSNGKKVYGDWSKEKIVVPYATVKKKTAVADGKVKITWSKVSGAKDYTIYKASSATGKYKKVKTVKGTSYTLTGVPYNKNQYIYVKANGVKVGKKKYSTTKATSVQNYDGFVLTKEYKYKY